MQWILAALLVLASVTSVAAQINIGINFPRLPRLVIVPDTPVAYAPDIDTNFFRYDNRYWVFKDNDWFTARNNRGPWSRIDPGHVPAPLLRVPVRYYRAAPAQWHEHAQAAHHPPAWESRYGEQWDRDHYKPEPHQKRGEQQFQRRQDHNDRKEGDRR